MQTRRAHDDIKFMTILCPQILLGSQVYTTMMVLSHLKGAIRGIMGLCYMIYFQTPFINYLGLQIILFMEANWGFQASKGRVGNMIRIWVAWETQISSVTAACSRLWPRAETQGLRLCCHIYCSRMFRNQSPLSLNLSIFINGGWIETILLAREMTIPARWC